MQTEKPNSDLATSQNRILALIPFIDEASVDEAESLLGIDDEKLALVSIISKGVFMAKISFPN